MSKVKVARKSTRIDMTAMSDVTVLLLTFFMLTSTFVKNEPVKVVTPGSVSEIKVPEKDVLNILVDKTGKVFMSMDNQLDLESVLTGMTDVYGVSLNGEQTKKFVKDPMFGVPMDQLSGYLSQSPSQMQGSIGKLGIPTDSVGGKKSEFQNWVDQAVQNNDKIKIAIKADANTPYKVVKKVMSELQDMNQNRYYLITSYKKSED